MSESGGRSRSYSWRGLHGELVHHIGRKIVSGEWKEGDVIPSDGEFGEGISVSRSVAARCCGSWRQKVWSSPARASALECVREQRGGCLTRTFLTGSSTVLSTKNCCETSWNSASSSNQMLPITRRNERLQANVQSCNQRSSQCTGPSRTLMTSQRPTVIFTPLCSERAITMCSNS